MAGAPTEEIVSGQGIQDAGGPDQVAHGGGESGQINPDGDKRVPDVDVSEETVISPQEDAAEEEDAPLKSKKTTRLVHTSPS